jgi:hypothetical protein
MMAKIAAAAIEQLKASLSSSAEIVTSESENYAESIKRWSTAAEEPAVSFLLIYSTLK